MPCQRRHSRYVSRVERPRHRRQARVVEMDGYRQGQFAVRSAIYYRRRQDTPSDPTAMKPREISLGYAVRQTR